MNAILLAAGLGRRLGEGGACPPKCLLRFGGKTLLRRHLEILRYCGVQQATVVVGYKADQIRAEIAAIDDRGFCSTVFNPDFEQGSLVSLWKARQHLTQGGPLLLMDADVIYDGRLLRRLVDSAHENCFLLDRDFEPGDEPVKLCVREGALAEFRKRVEGAYDFCGESVGFFKLSERAARNLAAMVQTYMDAGKTHECYEEALRGLLLSASPGTYGYEDITGLPWMEIDFPEDVRRAREEILPRLQAGRELEQT